MRFLRLSLNTSLILNGLQYKYSTIIKKYSGESDSPLSQWRATWNYTYSPFKILAKFYLTTSHVASFIKTLVGILPSNVLSCLAKPTTVSGEILTIKMYNQRYLRPFTPVRRIWIGRIFWLPGFKTRSVGSTKFGLPASESGSVGSTTIRLPRSHPDLLYPTHFGSLDLDQDLQKYADTLNQIQGAKYQP